MSFTMRAVKVPPPSASLEEARQRVFAFYKSACRSLPKVMEIYTLDDVVTMSGLRSSITSQFRKNAHITNPKVIDMLLIKGEEELSNVTEHAKQRHHIIGQYVVDRRVHEMDAAKEHSTSQFLQNFYTSNYF